ncbi:hypothetical protein TVAG_058180 [Trichomonas vaginalis G3]|uniref:Uncharacterized protein n=1 Tax=Trichomonas vaginalis (strain ATCC PRA-98 / G3) TaxID=412133 RepID=A2EQ78_TRIV3|nr:hypothetical protein TVAGG3_0586460 [Trichomonas vaginalis G3]EAY05161.1 hypothetical protein TVAG_058180 [Trichomonas vaginalis G3]KAI5522930.1 hypothetical protein TVAGG3_0586460 [Trichomonas vaginalis G3]|eukprot:XP_001317384.1 hypothetical protein [Trichomonas vaginalis G3]
MSQQKMHVIKIEKGKTNEYYSEIVKKGDETILLLYESDTAKFAKFDYDLKKTYASSGSTVNSLYLITPLTDFILVFDGPNDKNNFLQKLTAVSIIKKDNDYMETLQEQIAPTVKFSMHGIY